MILDATPQESRGVPFQSPLLDYFLWVKLLHCYHCCAGMSNKHRCKWCHECTINCHLEDCVTIIDGIVTKSLW